jgi:quinoprotein glucose dehydrogenase
VPLERTAKTQPFPSSPRRSRGLTFTAADIATVTPELEAACRKLIEGVQLGGPYLPVSYKRLRVQFPGNHGGVNWGGTSFNPQLDICSSTRTSSGQMSGLAIAIRRDRSRAGGRQGNRVDPTVPIRACPAAAASRTTRRT